VQADSVPVEMCFLAHCVLMVEVARDFPRKSFIKPLNLSVRVRPRSRGPTSWHHHLEDQISTNDLEETQTADHSRWTAFNERSPRKSKLCLHLPPEPYSLG
jgi:hypothetical protein